MTDQTTDRRSSSFILALDVSVNVRWVFILLIVSISIRVCTHETDLLLSYTSPLIKAEENGEIVSKSVQKQNKRLSTVK